MPPQLRGNVTEPAYCIAAISACAAPKGQHKYSPGMSTMYDWLARWAEVEPDRVALIDAADGREITYGALDERAARLAAGLAGELGVSPGDRVAVLANNRVEVFELLFACVKLGAVLVPLNWRLPPAELVPIVRDAAPRVLVHEREWHEVARAHERWGHRHERPLR